MSKTPAAQYYDEWLVRARVPIATVIGIAISFAFATRPSNDWLTPTPVAYTVAAALILWWGGATIVKPLRGDWSTRQIVIGAVVVAAIAIALNRFLHYGVCIYGGCDAFEPKSITWQYFIDPWILAPVFETIAFQGWLQTRLTYIFGQTIGFWATVVLFILVHIELSPTIVVAAVALCFLRAGSKSLACVMLAHALVNIGNSIAMLH